MRPLTEPPPAHAMLTKHGDLIAVRWAKTLEDREVAQASTWHDCWIRRTETEPVREFNEHGDQLVNAGNATAQAPLTLYNPWLKIGFKAVLYTPEGELEESAWEEARAVLVARAPPDGNEVQKLWIGRPTARARNRCSRSSGRRRIRRGRVPRTSWQVLESRPEGAMAVALD